MKKGFTLIELLIVVAIIAILAAIAVPNFLEAQVRAKVSRAKADMRSLATAIESYYVDGNKYPPFFNASSASVFYADVATGAVSSRYVKLTTPISYISSVFQDPFINSAVKFALSPSGVPNNGYDTYDYVEAISFYPAPIGITGVPRGGSITSGASWHVVSAGPDKINAFGGGRTNNGTDAEQLLGGDYDPTNGTISGGDVVRIGSGAASTFAGGGKPRFDRIQNKQNAFGEVGP